MLQELLWLLGAGCRCGWCEVMAAVVYIVADVVVEDSPVAENGVVIIDETGVVDIVVSGAVDEE